MNARERGARKMRVKKAHAAVVAKLADNGARIVAKRIAREEVRTRRTRELNARAARVVNKANEIAEYLLREHGHYGDGHGYAASDPPSANGIAVACVCGTAILFGRADVTEAVRAFNAIEKRADHANHS